MPFNERVTGWKTPSPVFLSGTVHCRGPALSCSEICVSSARVCVRTYPFLWASCTCCGETDSYSGAYSHHDFLPLFWVMISIHATVLDHDWYICRCIYVQLQRLGMRQVSRSLFFSYYLQRPDAIIAYEHVSVSDTETVTNWRVDIPLDKSKPVYFTLFPAIQ